MFVFIVCQIGTESFIKDWLQQRLPTSRLAFSRPGLLTFKLERLDIGAIESLSLLPLARTWGESWETVSGDLTAVAEVLRSRLPQRPPGHLHLWQRDRGQVGERGFEPFVGDEPDYWARQLSLKIDPQFSWGLNQVANRGESIVDVIQIDDGKWLVGGHQAAGPASRWPGGVPPIQPQPVISRAFYKLEEALLWSELPMRPGDRVVELGSAPGGACQALLQRGLHVIGVDPAEMDPALEQHPRFEHWRMRAAEIPKRRLRDVSWLVSDSNVAPKHTLDAVSSIALNQHVTLRGMVLTLKMPSWTLFAELDTYVQRLLNEGWSDVRCRHLAFNRQELCVVARQLKRG